MNQNSNNISSHIPFLDSLRGFAILIVVFSHIYGLSFGFYHLGWIGAFPDFDVRRSALLLVPLTYGNMGVAIFFVISGFCIHMSHVRSRETDFRNFFTRRFFRIYPAYLVAVLFFSFIYQFHLDPPKTVPSGVQLITHALLIHNITNETMFGINPSFWSLALEFQIYLLYPLLFLFASKWGWKRTLIALTILEIVLKLTTQLLYLTSHPEIAQTVYNTPFNYWLSWAIGAAMADAYLKNERLPFSNQPLSIWFVAWLVSNLILPLNFFSFSLFAVCTAIYMGRLLTKHSQTSVYKRPNLAIVGLTQLGIISYSLYLFHQPLLVLAQKITGRLFHYPVSALTTFAFALLILPMILAVSWLCYKYIELPSITLGKRFSQSFKTT